MPYASIIFGVLSLTYAFRGKTIAQYPSQRGMFVGTGLALLASAAWILVHPTSPALNSDSLLTIVSILLSALMIGLMAGYPFIRKRAGIVLYEVPRVQIRKISGFATAGMFFILIIFTLVRSDFSHETLAELVFYISVVSYFASPLFGKVELRENGILETYTLVRWKEISSYRWVGHDESNLTLMIRGSWRKSATIILPRTRKNRLNPS